MKLEPKIKMLNIRISMSMFKRLEAEALRRDMTVTAVVRELIKKSFGGAK